MEVFGNFVVQHSIAVTVFVGLVVFVTDIEYAAWKARRRRQRIMELSERLCAMSPREPIVEVSETEILQLTAGLDAHPAGWRHACACRGCREDVKVTEVLA